jgi:predicted RNase H-like nuclease
VRHEGARLLGARASTIFTPPSRSFLAAAAYADARGLIEVERVTNPAASGLSAQAFGLAPKIREADDYLRANADAQQWLFECHPELSSLTLAGKVLRDKISVGGQAERLALLSARFPDVPCALQTFPEGSRQAELADALDALVCLDTALRVRANAHEILGVGTDDVGLRMRMVC